MLKRGMGWLGEVPDVYSRPQWTERDERERRIALRVVAFAAPFIVAWIVASPLVHVFLSKSAEAKIRTLGYQSASIYNEIVPCRGWFDGGFTIYYETAPGTGQQTGKLCRKFGDDDWTWYPK